MLSIVAALTPFQNHNQSPRCMYQCQMLKQTMGTPYQNHPFRTDNKVYKIQSPQRPMVRAQMYNDTKFDTHPTGCNAVVAVITYTGYDMEDAMIINKMSYDRGFMAGNVFKQKIIHAAPEKDQKNRLNAANWRFQVDNLEKKSKITEETHIEKDGLPYIGQKMKSGMTLATSYNASTREQEVRKYKDNEESWVEQINVISGGSWHGGGIDEGVTKVSIKLRSPRRPLVGDKFATRHGQKG